jgi:hypothetical protein
MKLLTFQAERFAWRPHERTLDVRGSDEYGSAPRAELAPQSVSSAVVAFLHAEPKDEEPAQRDRALRHATKHIQWLTNKRGLEHVVLHSFTHLSGESAGAAFAEAWILDLRARLERKGFIVAVTPFGYTCAWELSVFGESLAKVWKEI